MDGHVARMGKIRRTYRILDENVKGRDRLGDLIVDGRMILK